MSTIRREGTIQEVKRGEAKVRIPRGGSCTGCSGCGEAEESGETRAVVRDTGNIRAGDRVILEGNAAGTLASALTLFILPLALLAAGFAAGPAFAAQAANMELSAETAGGILGGCGLLLPYLVLYLRRLYNRSRGRYDLHIVERRGGPF